MKTAAAKQMDINTQNKEKKTLVTIVLLWIDDNYPAILGEFFLTALLLFFGCLSCVVDFFNYHGFPLPSIGFGLTILFIVYSFGHISGAHMNPAVTLTAVILKTISVPLAIAYAIVQCLGATFGSYLLTHVTPGMSEDLGKCLTIPAVDLSVISCIVLEALLTCILCLLCCLCWDPLRPSSQDESAVKFALTVGGLAMIGGPLTGASMNPARSLGPAIVTNVWRMHYVYWFGPFIGAVLAPFIYKIPRVRRQEDGKRDKFKKDNDHEDLVVVT